MDDGESVLPVATVQEGVNEVLLTFASAQGLLGLLNRGKGDGSLQRAAPLAVSSVSLTNLFGAALITRARTFLAPTG